MGYLFFNTRATHPDETLQRRADHFEVLLGLVKVLSGDVKPSDRVFWRDRAQLVIDKAQAIIAGAKDPD